MMKKSWYFIPIFLLIVLTACQLDPFITVLKSETVTVTHEKALIQAVEKGTAKILVEGQFLVQFLQETNKPVFKGWIGVLNIFIYFIAFMFVLAGFIALFTPSDGENVILTITTVSLCFLIAKLLVRI